MNNKVHNLTVFTPTFNRAYILNKLYESLLRQTSKEFEWLIVDDGSSDDTKDIVASWIMSAPFTIRYVYQPNSGKAQAHNHGVNLARGYLFVCVDSDDYLCDDAVEVICETWKSIERRDCVGMLFCTGNEDGSPRTTWDSDVEYSTLLDGSRRHHLRNGALLIYRSDIIKRYCFPVIEGENFITEAYLYDQLDSEGLLRFVPKVLCIRSFLQDGYTMSIHQTIAKNPKGYKAFVLQRLKLDKRVRDVIDDLIRLVSINLVMGIRNVYRESPYPFATLLVYPFGILRYLVLYRGKRTKY